MLLLASAGIRQNAEVSPTRKEAGHGSGWVNMLVTVVLDD
jgi:hypothetical protein